MEINTYVLYKKVQFSAPFHGQFKKINYLLVKIMKKCNIYPLQSQFTVLTLYSSISGCKRVAMHLTEARKVGQEIKCLEGGEWRATPSRSISNSHLRVVFLSVLQEETPKRFDTQPSFVRAMRSCKVGRPTSVIKEKCWCSLKTTYQLTHQVG